MYHKIMYIYIFFLFLIVLDFSTVRRQFYNEIFLQLDFPLTTSKFYFFVYKIILNPCIFLG